VNGEGTVGIYFNEAAGADFGTPEAFQAGTLVAEASARVQSVVAVTAPQTGLANGSGDIVISSAEPFTIAESTFRFRVGEPISRISWVGNGTLLDPALPESMLYVSGNSWLP
jgi:hypothetical protein